MKICEEMWSCCDEFILGNGFCVGILRALGASNDNLYALQPADAPFAACTDANARFDDGHYRATIFLEGVSKTVPMHPVP